MHFDLSELGWSPERQRELEALGMDLIPARIAAVEAGNYRLAGCALDRATVTGRLRSERGGDLPVTGDWVALQNGRIAHVLSRRTTLARRSTDKSGRPQLACANIDKVLIVTAIGSDLSARRVERHLALTYEGGALPIVVLNKVDLVDDASELHAELRDAAPLVPIVCASAERDGGLAELMLHLKPGETIVLVGSSGVGKSSLVNRLLGEERQAVEAVRSGDDKGRHATTRREMFRTPGGVLVIDTPGVREVGLTANDAGVELAFSDVLELSSGCRFRDCAHLREPSCAVRAAVARGELSSDRLDAYHRLHVEISTQARKRREKQVAKAIRGWKKLDRGSD